MAVTRRGKFVAALGVVIALILIASVAGIFYLRGIGVLGSSHPGKEVSVVIPKGTSASEVGTLLADKGVIASSMGWRIRIFLDHNSPSIQAGRYQLRTGLTAGDAMDALTARGPQVHFVTVTFPEGSTLKQMAQAVGSDTKIPAKAFLDSATSGTIRSTYEPKNVKTLEGLIFPSTYQVISRDTAETLTKRLVDTFDKTFAALDTSELTDLHVTPYQAIVVASMVEEEAKVNADRPKIARVIYNRLERNMPLGIDATIEYALNKHASQLTESDLQIQSPYNTRIHTGLPPTPIAAAGKASLEAALHPAKGKWLYYVVKDCRGHHAFSTSYDKFLQDKSHYEALSC